MVWGIAVRDEKPPFKFDIGTIVRRLRRLPVSLKGVTIKIPFVDISVDVDRREKKLAREIVLRVADRRVLNSFECCDDFISNSIGSLQEIRRVILDKQVELSDLHDGVLYILLDALRLAIRQFLTFEETTRKIRDHRLRNDAYFAGLEILRDHIHRTLNQIAKIAGIEVPVSADYMRYDENWRLEAYKKPALRG